MLGAGGSRWLGLSEPSAAGPWWDMLLRGVCSRCCARSDGGLLPLRLWSRWAASLTAANGGNGFCRLLGWNQYLPRPPPRRGGRIRCGRKMEVSLRRGGGWGRRGRGRAARLAGPAAPIHGRDESLLPRFSPPGYHRPDPQPGPVPGQPCPAPGGRRHPSPGPAAGQGSPGCPAARSSRHAAALHGESPRQDRPGVALCLRAPGTARHPKSRAVLGG